MHGEAWVKVEEVCAVVGGTEGNACGEGAVRSDACILLHIFEKARFDTSTVPAWRHLAGSLFVAGKWLVITGR